MTKSQLHRAVARATGEDCDVIMYRGFSMVDDESPLHDDDIEALIADWDQIEAEEITSPSRHDVWSASGNRVPMSRVTKTRAGRMTRSANAAARARRTMDTAH